MHNFIPLLGLKRLGWPPELQTEQESTLSRTCSHSQLDIGVCQCLCHTCHTESDQAYLHVFLTCCDTYRSDTEEVGQASAWDRTTAVVAAITAGILTALLLLVCYVIYRLRKNAAKRAPELYHTTSQTQPLKHAVSDHSQRFTNVYSTQSIQSLHSQRSVHSQHSVHSQRSMWESLPMLKTEQGAFHPILNPVRSLLLYFAPPATAQRVFFMFSTCINVCNIPSCLASLVHVCVIRFLVWEFNQSPLTSAMDILFPCSFCWR